MNGNPVLQAELVGLRNLPPVRLSSRPSSTRSASLRRNKAQANGSVPTSPRLYLPTDPPTLSARPRKQATQTKVPDEWKTNFATWTDVSAGPPDEMVVDLLSRYGREFSLQQVLSLSRPRSLGKPEHDEQLILLQDFVGGACEYPPFPSPAQEPQAWLDHQLWLDDEAGAMTIPGRQPKRILSNADLDHELRPIVSLVPSQPSITRSNILT
jgi:hypothetical protein